MASSPIPAERRLGTVLSGTEAKEIADHLGDGDTLTMALRVIPASRRPEIRSLLEGIDERSGDGRQSLIAILRAIEGAKSAPTTTEPLWTMPGHLARNGRLTSSVTRLVAGARHAITCSTFNFQRSSSLWAALREAAQRPEVTMRVYVDTAAADQQQWRASPTTAEVAAHLAPATVLRTKEFDGRGVRNHAKLLAIDHRFLLVTSANYSWSAEYANIELGVLIDNQNLTEMIERELRQAEDFLFEPIPARPVAD